MLDDFHAYTWAVWQRDMGLFRGLLQACPHPINVLNQDGTTALTWSPNFEWTKLLLESGARVGLERPQDGATSLHCAAEAGRMDQLLLLLEELEFTGPKAVLEQFDFLGRTPLACAVDNGHTACLEQLLQAGANPDGVDVERNGETPLQRALGRSYWTCAQILLQAGADPKLSIGLTTPPYQLAGRLGVDWDAFCKEFAGKKKSWKGRRR